MADCLLVTTSVNSRETADRLAQALVKDRLAACAQVSGPIASTYQWHGAVEQASEWMCQLKTTRDRLAAIEAAFAHLHPYELPELTAVALDGSAAYLRWIRNAVAPESKP